MTGSNDCQRTTSPAGERTAETPQRPKDVKPAADILEVPLTSSAWYPSSHRGRVTAPGGGARV